MTTPRSGARPTDEADNETLLGAHEDITRRPIVIARGSTLGRYVVLDRLGSGGMGVVFAAYDPELDRKVAVKVLQATSARWSKATSGRARLLREAQAMAKLSHPNVVPVYDVGTIGDDVFLAMEFIAGVTLRAWVDSKREAATLDWRATLRLYVEAGRGVAAAHAAGIVHRDFKPENVMVDEHQRARVLDFGLARSARDTNASSDDAAAEVGAVELRLTATGAVMGTPFYMAPEQHRGDEIDERADQFSFCVALWESLYGERPFSGTSLPELARTVLQGELKDPPRAAGIPPWVRRALGRGLATDPNARFASMDDLLAELGRDPGARRRLLALSAGLVTASTAAVVAVLFVARTEPPCRDLGAGLEDMWNDDARESVRRAFVPLTAADGAGAFERVSTQLDAYAKEWTATRFEACEATRVRNEQSEQILDLRYKCLDARMYRVEALLELFAAADNDVVFQATSLVQQLLPVADCNDIPRLRQVVPAPTDPALAAQVQDIQRRLARAEARGATGHLEQVLAELGDLVVESEATGYRPLLGDVLVMRGRIAMFFGNDTLAKDSFQRAELIAEAEGYDGLICEAVLWLAVFEATRTNDFEQAHRNLARAGAVLQRMGYPRLHKTHLLLSTARVYAFEDKDQEAADAYERFLDAMKESGRDADTVVVAAMGAYGHLLGKLGRRAEAEQVIDEALVRGKKALGNMHPEVGAMLIYRARLLSAEDRLEESLAVFDEALAIHEKALGMRTVNAGAVLNDQALVLAQLGRFEEALAKLERAAPIIRDVYGEKNVQYAAVLVNFGETLVELGRVDEAVARVGEAVEIRRQLLGTDHVMYGSALGDLGDALLENGRLEAAAEAYEGSRAIMLATYGEDGQELADSELGLGDIALASGEFASAEQHYTRAMTLLEGTKPHDARRAQARFGLARIEAATGDREAALTLARQARDGLADRPGSVRKRKAIARFIAEHSVDRDPP